MYIKGSWRYEEIMPIRSYRSLSLDLPFYPKTTFFLKSWKSINLHNLLAGALRKPPSRAEFSKRNWFLGRLSLNLLKKPHSFWKWALKSQIWKYWKWWFEKTTFTSRILKRNVVFVEIKRESTQKPHSFWKSALKSPDLKMVHWENHPHKQNF